MPCIWTTDSTGVAARASRTLDARRLSLLATSWMDPRASLREKKEMEFDIFLSKAKEY